MNELPIGQMPVEEFVALMEGFISRRSGADDRLPGDVIFELLGQAEKARLQPAAKEAPVRVKGYVRRGQLVLTAPPPGSLLQTEGNRVRWADGCEMVIELEVAG
jgi:hypothetical protein